MYVWDFASLWEYRSLLLAGIGTTLFSALTVIAAGLSLGVTVGLGRLSPRRCLRGALGVYVAIFQCTPVLVQLLWFYYALPMLLGIALTPMSAAMLCLTLYGGAFYAEIVRGGMLAVDAGQTLAALALGMTRAQALWRVVLPQALRHMTAPLAGQSALQLKNTALLSVIAIPDLLHQGQLIAHETYRPLEIYTLVAALYFLLLYPILILVKRLEKARA